VQAVACKPRREQLERRELLLRSHRLTVPMCGKLLPLTVAARPFRVQISITASPYVTSAGSWSRHILVAGWLIHPPLVPVHRVEDHCGFMTVRGTGGSNA
jgi:hypothetical protein